MRRLLILALLVVATLGILPALPAHAAVLEYACKPSSSTWTVLGAWGDGAVFEGRACIRADTSAHRVSGYFYFRVRRGGDALQTNWLLTDAIGNVYSVTTGQVYGERSDWGNAYGPTFIKVSTYWGCSGTGGTQQYISGLSGIAADPFGSLPPSQQKTVTSYYATDSYIAC